MLIPYIGAAVLPALVLMIYVYKKDTVEKEPVDLLIKLIIAGCLAAALAGSLETVASSILDTFVSRSHPFYIVLFAFLVVAVVEEGTKYLLLKWRTWKHPAFNYCFDGIVYAAFVSLGFAALENVGYVFGYGLTVAPIRAVLAIPGHLSFSVFMGYFYGRAKRWEKIGETGQSIIDRTLGYLLAVFLHGFYDTCAMMNNSIATVIFFIFVVMVDIAMLYMIRRGSREDEPL